jgi:hypothetical protein
MDENRRPMTAGNSHVLALDRAFHPHVLPISLALRKVLGPCTDLDEAYEHVVGVMQQALDELASERRLPVIG